MINYYFGEYLPSDLVPWHFRLVWFLITTPVIILFLFILGLVLFFKEIYKKIGSTLDNKKDFSQKHFISIFLFMVFLFSFFILIEFNKSKYGGWRHLYFLYPIVIYFSILFVNHLLHNSSNIFRNIIFIFIFFNLANCLFWTMKNHPHQYIFFNFLTKSYALKNFDLDWWGISHKASLEYILKNTKKDKIKVFAEGFTSLKDSHLYLESSEKKRVVLTGIEEADYVIDSKMKRIRINNYMKENNNFELIYELNVDGQAISALYLRKE